MSDNKWTEKKLNEKLHLAVQAYNYPEENGEYPYESYETIGGILGEIPDEYKLYKKLTKKLYDELGKCVNGEDNIYTLANFIFNDNNESELRLFNFEVKAWVKYP
ncbi:hypothetical protein KAR10_01015 [bacterium]|nr:hypothetical protein [bacterium]